MAVAKKPSVNNASITAKPGTGSRAAAGIKAPAAKTRASTNAALEPAFSGTLVPVAPETRNPDTNMRKRLSKAFSRPLDKKLKKETLVRDRFTFPEVEYAQFANLKKRLLEQEMTVKKGELVRAGLMLLSSLDDINLKEVLAKVPSID